MTTDAATVRCPGYNENGCGAVLPVTNFGGMCYVCGAAYLDDELLDLFVRQHGYMEAETSG